MGKAFFTNSCSEANDSHVAAGALPGDVLARKSASCHPHVPDGAVKDVVVLTADDLQEECVQGEWRVKVLSSAPLLTGRSRRTLSVRAGG